MNQPRSFEIVLARPDCGNGSTGEIKVEKFAACDKCHAAPVDCVSMDNSMEEYSILRICLACLFEGLRELEMEYRGAVSADAPLQHNPYFRAFISRVDKEK